MHNKDEEKDISLPTDSNLNLSSETLNCYKEKSSLDNVDNSITISSIAKLSLKSLIPLFTVSKFLSLLNSINNRISRKILSKLNTLCIILNVDEELLMPYTRNKNRVIRMVATSCIYEGITKKIKSDSEYSIDIVDRRIRDVDHNIRILTLEYINKWIALIEHKEIIKYNTRALNDKHELVRKRALKNCRDIIKEEHKYKDIIKRIKEISIKDKNQHAREEAANTLFYLYKNSIINKKDLYEVLKEHNNKNIIRYIIDDECINKDEKDKQCIILNKIHNLYKNTNLKVIENLTLKEEEKIEIIENIFLHYKESITCCNSIDNNLCMLEILSTIKHHSIIKTLKELLSILREDRRKIILIYKILSTIEDCEYKRHSDIVIELLDTIYYIEKHNKESIDKESNESNDKEGIDNIKDSMDKESNESNDKDNKESIDNIKEGKESIDNIKDNKYILIFLKKIEEEYKNIISSILEVLDPNTVIQYFSIPQPANSSSLFNCYYSLWKIIEEDYNAINNIEFRDTDHLDKLCTFLLYFKSKLPNNYIYNNINYNIESIEDIFKVLYNKLYNTIESIVHIDKYHYKDIINLIDNNILVSKISLLPMDYILHIKNKNIIIDYYIDNIILYNTVDKENKGSIINNKDWIVSLTKKISFRLRGAYFFNKLRSIAAILKVHVLDDVLIHLLGVLGSKEAIVLEGLVADSKFREALRRKGKRDKFRRSPDVSVDVVRL